MDIEKIFFRLVGYGIACAIALCICALLGSCRTQCPDITEDMFIHDTLQVYNIQKDSVWLHDSVFQERYVQGDTVFMYKYREHVAYKDKLVHDSIYINKNDTIVQTVTKEVAAKKTFIDKAMETLGGIFLIAILMLAATFALYFILKRYKLK